jgi:hypothetical protein
MKKILLFVLMAAGLSSCSENYSNGERIGVITQFSRSGAIWKSWEGHLNVTQTGMNSSVPFDFSIDNDNENDQVIKTIDSAANYGWKVKLVYHETAGKNWWNNRGETNHFIQRVDVLDRSMGSLFHNNTPTDPNRPTTGINWKPGMGVHDTIYVVIYKDKP